MRRVPTGLNRVLYVLYHGLFAITCIALAYKGKGSLEASQLLIFYEYVMSLSIRSPVAKDFDDELYFQLYF